MTLSTALRGNAAFTALCSLVTIAEPGWVAVHTALSASIWATGLGLMLASYVPVLLFASARPFVWLVKTIIVLDWSYVAMATGFLLTHFDRMDPVGLGLIAPTTTIIAVFAWIQMRCLADLQRGSTE